MLIQALFGKFSVDLIISKRSKAQRKLLKFELAYLRSVHEGDSACYGNKFPKKVSDKLPRYPFIIENEPCKRLRLPEDCFSCPFKDCKSWSASQHMKMGFNIFVKSSVQLQHWTGHQYEDEEKFYSSQFNTLVWSSWHLLGWSLCVLTIKAASNQHETVCLLPRHELMKRHFERLLICRWTFDLCF